ncbi:hypothetical protein STEG23_025295 [Scotinomys teguina]
MREAVRRNQIDSALSKSPIIQYHRLEMVEPGEHVDRAPLVLILIGLREGSASETKTDGLISRIYKDLKKQDIKTPDNSIEKCGIYGRRISNGQKTLKEMFNILTHQRNANQNNSKKYLDRRIIMGLGRNLVLGKTPESTGKPQLRLQVLVEMVPELAFPCNQSNDYLNCHHRTFIQ